MGKIATRDKKINFIMAFINAHKMLQLYPPNNPIPQSAVEQVFNYLNNILQEEGSACFRFSRQGIYEGDEKILEADSGDRIASFCSKIIAAGISSLVFFHGITKSELMALLTLLIKEPSEIEKEGGAAKYLEDKKVEYIKVNEIPREVHFSESGKTVPAEQAARTNEINLLDLLSSLLLKDDFNENELKLIGHLLSKPEDLRSVLYHVYSKGSSQGGNINLLEKAVLKLNELIERRLQSNEAARESLFNAISTLPPKVNSQLITSLVLSAVRKVAAKNFLESFSPDSLGNQILEAHKNEIIRIERLSLALNKIEFNPDFKQALQEKIKQGLVEMGYTADEAEVISGGEKIENIEEEVEKGGYGTAKDIQTVEVKIEAGDLEESTADLKLLNGLKLEALKYKSDEHIFRSLISMVTYVENEKVLSELENHLRYLFPSLLSEDKFSVLNEAASYLKLLIRDKKLEDFKVAFASRLHDELTKEKYIYQIFEKMTLLDKESQQFSEAFKFLSKLPRETVISTFIKILSTEEILSRRKLLISLLTELSRENPEFIGKRIDTQDSKWYLTRNLCTILGAIGKESCIPYLEEALKHPDLRVKKEAVKAISEIGGEKAANILIEEYFQADTDLKKLILKNIGNTGNKKALEILLPVAESRDFLLRDYELKLCAIESLVKIPCTESVQVLERLSKLKSLFARRKAKEIAAAARMGLQAIKAKARGE